MIDFATWYLHPDRMGFEVVLPQLEAGQSTTTSGEDVVRDDEDIELNMSWQAAHEAEYNLALTDEERGRIQMHADDPEAQEAWAFRDDDEREEDDADDEDADAEAVGSSAVARDLAIARMLSSGMITRVTSPWASVARYPNGALDYRVLNEIVSPPRDDTTVESELQLRPSRVITPAEDELELRWELHRRAGNVPSDLLRALQLS
jgi:hypothetical protein